MVQTHLSLLLDSMLVTATHCLSIMPIEIYTIKIPVIYAVEHSWDNFSVIFHLLSHSHLRSTANAILSFSFSLSFSGVFNFVLFNANGCLTTQCQPILVLRECNSQNTDDKWKANAEKQGEKFKKRKKTTHMARTCLSVNLVVYGFLWIPNMYHRYISMRFSLSSGSYFYDIYEDIFFFVHSLVCAEKAVNYQHHRMHGYKTLEHEMSEK